MKIFFSLSLLALTAALTTVGCSSAPAAKPTSVATVSPVVITVVVTATPAGTSTLTPTLTPTTTLTTTAGLTGTQTLVATKPTNTTGPARPTSTRRPAGTAVAASTPSPSPLALKYGAVRPQRPIYEGSNPGDQRDERHYPSDSIAFEWLANGALGADECYQIRTDMKSNADGSTVGDAFIQCDPQETQKAAGQIVRFVLNKPSGPGPTYAALIPSGAGDLTTSWSVTIVKDAGVIPSGGAYAVDGTRHKVLALSPVSQVVSFPLKGAAH